MLFEKNTFVVLMLLGSLVLHAGAGKIVKCASTTSLQNSGFFEYILPLFEKDTGIKVYTIAVGTGAALAIGKRGDADVVFVHSKEDELKMLEQGWFVYRKDVMYNDFIIAGPPEDPAGILSTKTAIDAFKAIARSGVKFVSRGDSSGTHKREIKIWKLAGINPRGEKWYMEVGQGMAKALRMASNLDAYILTDRATYLSLIEKEKLHLVILFDGDTLLYNQYGIMAVNPEIHPHVNYKEAIRFINWIVSEKGKKAIASFKDSHGNQLFHPGMPR